MKRALYPIAFFCLVATGAIVSCKKTNNQVTPVTPTPSLNTLFSAFRSVPQTIVVDAGTDVTVFGDKGTLLHFYNYSFRNNSGATITSGKITVELTEMYSPADIINNRVTTMMPTGEILQSTGQVMIKATMNGQEVFTNGYGIGFRQKDSSSAPMGLFYGSTSRTDSTISWAQSDAQVNFGTQRITTYGVLGGTSNTRVDTCYYFSSCRNLNFANCGWFIDPYSSRVGVSVVLPDASFNNTNTEIYLVLPKTNAGWAGSAVISNLGDLGVSDSNYFDTSNTLILKSIGNTGVVPPGFKYELVVMANKEGKYYYWSNSGVVPGNGILVNAALTEARQDSIAVWLKKL